MCNVLYVCKPEGSGAALTAEIEAHGHDVMLCRSLAEGRDIFLQTKPDIVICDIDMSEGSGVEFIYRLRRRVSKFRSFEAIISAENLTDWELEDIYDCGVDEVITTPYNYDMVLAFKRTASC